MSEMNSEMQTSSSESDLLIPISPVVSPISILSPNLPSFNEEALLGTLRGVLIPTLEFMWSILIFVRFGYLTGEAGILASWATVLIVSLTVLLTTTSLSAIATNGIPSIDVYHILEKSLGRGMGGSIALIYYFAVTLLISIEIVGSVQGFLMATNMNLVSADLYWNQVVLSIAILLVCFVIVFAGTQNVHHVAFLFLAVLAISFAAMLFGLIMIDEESSPFVRRHDIQWFPSSDFSFSETVSLIVPCYIGIFSGINHARSLKRPFVSIPRGTLAANGVSTILYIILIGLFGLQIDQHFLREDYSIGPRLAWPTKWITIPGLIVVGMGATLQCILMASSVLNSLIQDEILGKLKSIPDHLPNFLTESNPPRYTQIITLLLTLPLMFVNVEVLASLTTMCFLLCYSFTNLVCCLLCAFKSPNWRPQFKYHGWALSLLGFVLCIVLMFQIQWYSALLSLLVALSIAYAIQTSSSSLSWGQGLHGLIFHIMIRYLAAVEYQDFGHRLRRFLDETESSDHQIFGISSGIPQESLGIHLLPSRWSSRIWRPQVVCFVKILEDGSIQHQRLLSFISQLSLRSTLCMLVHVIAKEEELTKIDIAAHRRKLQQAQQDQISVSYSERREMIDEISLERKFILQQAMEQENILGFVKVMSAPNVRIGQRIFMQTMGLGELTPNTVVVGWPDDTSSIRKDESLLHVEEIWQLSKRLDLSCLIVKGLQSFPCCEDRVEGDIDVWWIVQDGQLLLLVAYLLKQHEVWHNCSIRLFAICHISDNVEDIVKELEQYMDFMRIQVSSVIAVPIELIDISAELSSSVPASTKLRGKTMASKMTSELRFHDNIHAHKRAYTSGGEFEDERFHKHRRKISTTEERPRLLFVNSRVIQQLKQVITTYSAHSQLVIYNLPAPQESAERALKHSIYMDLIEYLTDTFQRSILVFSQEEHFRLQSIAMP